MLATLFSNSAVTEGVGAINLLMSCSLISYILSTFGGFVSKHERNFQVIVGCYILMSWLHPTAGMVGNPSKRIDEFEL